MVPHHSTDSAINCLTAQIGRDAVGLVVYGRSSKILDFFKLLTCTPPPFLTCFLCSTSISSISINISIITATIVSISIGISIGSGISNGIGISSVIGSVIGISSVIGSVISVGISIGVSIGISISIIMVATNINTIITLNQSEKSYIFEDRGTST